MRHHVGPRTALKNNANDVFRNSHPFRLNHRYGHPRVLALSHGERLLTETMDRETPASQPSND